MGFCKLSGTGMMNKYSWTENISAHAFRLENVQIKLVSSSEPILGFSFFAEMVAKEKMCMFLYCFWWKFEFPKVPALFKKKKTTHRAFLKMAESSGFA